jgi:hypothetical protein
VKPYSFLDTVILNKANSVIANKPKEPVSQPLLLRAVPISDVEATVVNLSEKFTVCA